MYALIVFVAACMCGSCRLLSVFLEERAMSAAVEDTKTYRHVITF